MDLFRSQLAIRQCYQENVLPTGEEAENAHIDSESQQK